MRKKVFIILAVLVLVLTAQTLDCIQSAMSSAREVGSVSQREAGQLTGSMLSESIPDVRTVPGIQKGLQILVEAKGLFSGTRTFWIYLTVLLMVRLVTAQRKGYRRFVKRKKPSVRMRTVRYIHWAWGL